MGTLSIIGLIFSVLMSAGGMVAQHYANEENKKFAEGNREDEQQFAHEEAEIARQANVEQYNQLYSPQAKVKQYEEAGLSPALMYSNGAAQGASGVTTQMAASPSHSTPYMNPLLNINDDNPVQSALQNIQQIQDIKKTKAETQNVQENTKLVAQRISESQKLIDKMESEIQCNVVTKANDELKGKLLANEIKISNATLGDQIEIVKSNLELINATQDKIKKEIDILRIEEGKKAEYLQTSIDLMNAEKMKYGAETILAGAEAELARIKYKLTQTEINLNIKQRNKLMQEIEEKEIELKKLRNSPLWSERGLDRVTGLSMSIGEEISQFAKDAAKLMGEYGQNKYSNKQTNWDKNGENLKQLWDGNWVPFINEAFMKP